MRWKQVLAIGLSAAMMMSVVPEKWGTRVYADTKMEAIKNGSEKTLKEASAKEDVTDSEYGKVIHSEAIEGTEITWTVYDSGKLVIEGTGVTPDRAPWFNYKEYITDVIVGDGITGLGGGNFQNYENLKTITVQGSLTKVGVSAFEGCKKLKSIKIAGQKILSLWACAFKDCTDLEDVDITMEASGWFGTQYNAFEGCTSLRSIKVKGSSRIMLGKYTFINCSALTEADLPGSQYKSVGEGAFYGCSSLKKFDFSGMTSIAEAAFYGCKSLESIEIPENVTKIEKTAFKECSGIKTLKIPKTVTEIGEGAFGKCTGLEELDMEDGVKTVGKAAFADCENLKTMILPQSVSSFPNDFVTDYRPIERICYRGNREQWTAANLNSDKFFNATVYFEYDPNHKHEMITRSYTYPDSCTQTGTKKTFCKVCGYEQSLEEIPAQGHSWKVESTEKGTCTKAGVKHLVCTRCGEKKDETIPAEHSFSAWETTAEASVFSAAVQTRTCSGCGKKETRTIGNKLAPTMKVNAVKLPLKTKQKTKVLKVTDLAKGDFVASWKSSNVKVAKVSGSANGTCTITAGKKTGKAVITVTLKSGLKKNIMITVQKKAVKTTKITGITKKASLTKGKTLALKPAVVPLTSLQKITYRSSNKKVATVTSKGMIKAKKKGTAVITVKSGSKTVKCKVTVK